MIAFASVGSHSKRLDDGFLSELKHAAAGSIQHYVAPCKHVYPEHGLEGGVIGQFKACKVVEHEWKRLGLREAHAEQIPFG